MASCVTATIKTPGYFLRRCVLSITIISLQVLMKDLRQTLNAQKNLLKGSSDVVSMFVIVHGLVLCNAPISNTEVTAKVPEFDALLFGKSEIFQDYSPQ